MRRPPSSGPASRPCHGDVTDPGHRDHLAEVVADGLDLLVNNASTLGTSPLLPVQQLTSAVLRHVWETNVVAPVALIRTLRPLLRDSAAVIDITSDAAAEHYETWGAYAASKAALEHLTLTLAAEDPDVRWYAVDPGDLRTQMHQDAFPGEDISDRPLPATVVPSFLALIDQLPPSGRYRAAELRALVEVPGLGQQMGAVRVTTIDISPLITFTPPGERTAPSPAEARGIARDEVRLLVADGDRVRHTHFRDLADHLEPGDLIVVNTSQTVAGEVDARLSDGSDVVVHVAMDLRDGTWVVEVRTAPDAARAVLDATPGQVLTLTADGAALTLLDPYPRTGSSPTGEGNRLWRAVHTGNEALRDVLARVGRPIAYGYLDQRYDLADYQTIFGTTPGSAEMPSASRPFTHEVVTRLVSRGVGIAPVLLHTGVSSQEAGRGTTAGVVRGRRVHGAAGEQHACRRGSHHRGRHHGDPRTRVRRDGRIRAARSTQRLDGARRHP